MIYITEIADKEIRGALGMTVQVMNNFGSLLVYSIGPFVTYTTLNWIIMIIPICYVLLCSWIPESPYYHLKDGRIEAAKKEFMRLKRNHDERVSIVISCGIMSKLLLREKVLFYREDGQYCVDGGIY